MSGPRLLLVTGLPCAGKTTLATELARRLGWPCHAKDPLKELLFDALGTGDRAWSRKLSAAAFELLFSLARTELAAGRSLVLEGNFDPARESARYAALLAETGAACTQLLVVAAGEELLRRFRARTGARHPGHLDEQLLQELEPRLRAALAEPLSLPGARVVRVDTTEPAGLDLDALVRSLRPPGDGATPR